ncbi:hypothetical protein [Streptomyces sp. 35G-GA-8]|uniref:hypothetical protein n=1 Tax=Streptomyces sp. 35G-GA-8 TaxID=2939434 RepID=UPI00201F7019|nr:hypothetical protein [Streptomyces sp. 35G-GA-8]MCL7380029.1 hypothetical protein [Streptomyces sp. 35G-GA-8]
MSAVETPRTRIPSICWIEQPDDVLRCTARTPAHTAPACRIGEHAECPGPGETRLAWQTAAQPPIETLRCACACHRGRS